MAWAKNLKDKKNPNDNKKTPLKLAQKLIDMTPLIDGDVVLDGFAGEGAFINQYPEYITSKWCEINYKKDFFKWKEKVDWVGPTNPPYSKINQVFEHSVKIASHGIAFLIGIINLTPKRIAILESAGFGITHMHLVQVTGWFGKSLYIVAQKGYPSIFTCDPISYRMPPDEDLVFKKDMKKYQEKYYKKKFRAKMIKYRKNNKNN